MAQGIIGAEDKIKEAPWKEKINVFLDLKPIKKLIYDEG